MSYGDWRNEHKTNCYFYSEDQDMGASIPCCRFGGRKYGECPCQTCPFYFPKSKADQIIREHVLKEKTT